LNPLVIESFENIWIFEHTHINTSANYTYVHTYSEREKWHFEIEIAEKSSVIMLRDKNMFE